MTTVNRKTFDKSAQKKRVKERTQYNAVRQYEHEFKLDFGRHLSAAIERYLSEVKKAVERNSK